MSIHFLFPGLRAFPGVRMDSFPLREIRTLRRSPAVLMFRGSEPRPMHWMSFRSFDGSIGVELKGRFVVRFDFNPEFCAGLSGGFGRYSLLAVDPSVPL